MDICRRQFGASLLAGVAGGALLARNRPKLLVLVLIEQLAADLVDALEPRFGAGGFRRLMDRGVWFSDCRHLATSFPATSIATLATGAWPAQHGIVADYWYDRASRRVTPAGAGALETPTLAAQVAATPPNRAYTVSLDRPLGAIWSGSNQVRQFWMEDGGRFASNGEAPEWLAEYNNLKPLENLRDAAWMAVGARPGAPPLRTLRFDETRPADFQALYKASPFAEEAQFAFLAELVMRERLGQGDGVDLVCLLASSSALLGYETGSRSPLLEQMVLRLDEHLAFLLDRLGHALGESGFAFALAGAHGAPPLPSAEARGRMAVSGEWLAQTMDRALINNGGKVEKYVYPFVYLEPAAGRDAEQVRLAAARAAMDQPQVAGFLTAGGACSASNAWATRFRNSFYPRRSGDLMLSYRAECIEEPPNGRGVSYGSLYNYDTRAPLFFYGSPFGFGPVDSPVEAVDLAPTLARALAVAPPAAAVGRSLAAAFTRQEA